MSRHVFASAYLSSLWSLDQATPPENTKKYAEAGCVSNRRFGQTLRRTHLSRRGSSPVHASTCETPNVEMGPLEVEQPNHPSFPHCPGPRTVVLVVYANRWCLGYPEFHLSHRPSHDRLGELLLSSICTIVGQFTRLCGSRRSCVFQATRSAILSVLGQVAFRFTSLPSKAGHPSREPCTLLLRNRREGSTQVAA